MVTPAATPAMLANKIFFISHSIARVARAIATKGSVNRYVPTTYFGSVLHRCHTAVNAATAFRAVSSVVLDPAPLLGPIIPRPWGLLHVAFAARLRSRTRR